MIWQLLAGAYVGGAIAVTLITAYMQGRSGVGQFGVGVAMITGMGWPIMLPAIGIVCVVEYVVKCGERSVK